MHYSMLMTHADSFGLRGDLKAVSSKCWREVSRTGLDPVGWSASYRKAWRNSGWNFLHTCSLVTWNWSLLRHSLLTEQHVYDFTITTIHAFVFLLMCINCEMHINRPLMSLIHVTLHIYMESPNDAILENCTRGMKVHAVNLSESTGIKI